MSDGISISFVDFAVVSFTFDRVCCASFRSFLVRNWCGSSGGRLPEVLCLRIPLPDQRGQSLVHRGPPWAQKQRYFQCDAQPRWPVSKTAIANARGKPPTDKRAPKAASASPAVGLF